MPGCQGAGSLTRDGSALAAENLLPSRITTGSVTQVRVPTLIIEGDHDASIPIELSGQVCAALIEGSELFVYENAPHGLYLTHGARLTADIIEFAKG